MSTHAVSITNVAKSELANFDPVLARAQAKFEFKLAEVDIQLEKSIETVLQKTRSMEQAVVGPAHRFGATLSGVQEVIQYLSGELEPLQNDGDASSTPK
jgi:hypothetical protein